ncbi:MAG: acetyl-CoA carboxylase biotin carboxyl carrier protein subunit [Anaerolineae bacterium]|nr:MAG: acetyl-CoA carboxylase biotin carboxyl carrier protein subunit [Anaerolineae bacterium]
MPGHVLDVLVRVGDAVERGQTLLLLEAMKMELRLAAPRRHGAPCSVPGR